MLISLRAPDSVAKRYLLAAEEANKSGHSATADILYRKVGHAGTDNEAKLALFRQAAAAFDAGRQSTAWDTINSLATCDEQGLLTANLWIASRLIDENARPLAIDNADLQIERHLNYLLEQANLTLELRDSVRRLLAAHYGNVGRPQESQALLTDGNSDFRDRQILMRLYQRYGKTESAKREARLLNVRFENASSLTTHQLIAYCEAVSLLDNPSGAIETLVRHIDFKNAKVDQELTDFAVEACLAELDGGSHDPVFIQTTERLDANNFQYATHLAKLAATESDHGPYRQIVRQKTRDGTWSFTAAKNAGAYAIQAKQYRWASEQLEYCLEHQNDSNVQNNLAWLQLKTSDGDLDRGLDLINQAISQDAIAEYFETRGQILAKMEKPKLAAIDLKQAINGLPNSVSAHETFAQVQHQLGNPQLASLYQQRAQSIRTVAKHDLAR